MTEAQVAALEQWAREAKKWEMVRTDEWPDAILALYETVRAQGAALRDGVRENWAMQHERDAAVARAEQAERERDEARTDLDGWVKLASSSRCIYCGQEFVHDPHDQESADEPKKAQEGGHDAA